MNLITWNIQRGRRPGQACSLDHVVASLHAIADADIVCLQEVSAGFTDLEGCDGANQFVGLARRLPEYTPVAGLAIDMLGDTGTRQLFGNMIFSRYPVLQVIRHALPWPADPGVMSMQRLALEATLDTPLGMVRVCTTHLEYFSLRQRTAQVARLRDLHAEAGAHAVAPRPGDAASGPFCAVPRAAPALLCGDFNFLPGTSEHLLMQAPHESGVAPYRDLWEVAHPGVQHAPTVGVGGADSCTFDFVFATDDMARRVRSMRVCAEVEGGDHQPVVVGLA